MRVGPSYRRPVTLMLADYARRPAAPLTSGAADSILGYPEGDRMKMLRAVLAAALICPAPLAAQVVVPDAPAAPASAESASAPAPAAPRAPASSVKAKD